ncbi:peptidase M24, structural domain-containing protein [Pelagophyceae sp. CCMP2097]|nr:peptidase M24, structural domain-containing protein [Pelagophyceae sp. CCMP2097]
MRLMRAARAASLAVLLDWTHGFDGGGKGFSATSTRKKAKPAKPVKPAQSLVPDDIPRPNYASSGKPSSDIRPSWMIEVKSAVDVEAMRISGKIAREVLDETGRAVRPGMTTADLDIIAHAATIARGAYPSPLNYHGFPKSLCTSVNDVICHGIPSADQVLRAGDMINLDVTIFHGGFHGDCSEMFYVGGVEAMDAKGKELVEVTYDAWQRAIAFCEPGRSYKDIGALIEDRVKKSGFSTVEVFCGHGIGRLFHTNPNILHYRNDEPNGIMAVGHTFTIEPMICEGTNEQRTWDDGWTAVTKDGRRSAQFEHTLLITPSGVEALTGKLDSSPKQPWE